MRRAVWAVALAAWFGFMVWKIDWLWSLSEPWLSFAQVIALLLLAVCVVGVILPPQWAGGVQAVIGFLGVLALWGGALTSL
ncbi:MAG: hypothetical protein LUC47_11090 [Clostridiales bacterium]|nr:hypothetical protein [Clostridiales bacterium]